MDPRYFYFVFLAALAGAYLGWRYLKRRRAAHLLAQSLDDHERAIVRREVPLLRDLPDEYWPALEGRMRRFLDQVKFYGFEGLAVSEAMRLSIAAQAALLVVNKDRQWYDGLESVYLYPDAYQARRAGLEGGVEQEGRDIRLGEAWMHGPVVLSWAHTKEGAADPHDGRNVVFHEFAHQLDQGSGRADGLPVLDAGHDHRAWVKTLQPIYETLQRNAQSGRATFLDPYGATDPAEFFAVSTEVFFERPAALKDALPGLYDQLATYFRLDPANWRGDPVSPSDHP